MADLSIDVSQLKQLSRDLRRASPALQKEFLVGLGQAGDIVASKAKTNADFSSRIPGTIKVRRRGVKVRVVAGGSKAPNAGPLNNAGVAGTFRHPVFGNYDVWVSQAAHPFLEPALEESLPEVTVQLLHAVDVAFVAAGFHA